MPGSTNFQQWNPTSANQENDAQYTADTLRANGAPTNAILPSKTFNKAFYQASTFVTAFAQSLVAKGFTITDTTLAGCQAILATVASTFADIISLLGFIPVQQGTGLNQSGGLVKLGVDNGNANRLRCTLGVTDEGDLAYTSDLVAEGIFGKKIQTGTTSPSQTTITFPVAFSATPVVVAVGVGGSVNLASVSPSGFTLNLSGGIAAHWIAIGAQ